MIGIFCPRHELYGLGIKWGQNTLTFFRNMIRTKGKVSQKTTLRKTGWTVESLCSCGYGNLAHPLSMKYG
jgi:hypothetical protein